MANKNLAKPSYEKEMIGAEGKKFWIVYVTNEQPVLCRYKGRTPEQKQFFFEELQGTGRNIRVQNLDFLAGMFEKKPTWEELENTGAWTKD